jgi:hypothetical protein
MFVTNNNNNDQIKNKVDLISNNETTIKNTSEKVDSLKKHLNQEQQKELIDCLNKNEIENKEQIIKDSKLDLKDFSLPPFGDTNNSDAMAQLYAHIMGDTLISGTNLEGSSFEKTGSYMSDFLDFLLNNKELNLPKELITTFIELKKEYSNIVQWHKEVSKVISSKEKNRDQDLRALADKITHEISSLGQEGKGTRFTLGGGWRGSPSGHAMLYEFILNKDGSYDVAIYNTGAGVETYHDRLLSGNKNLIRPIVRYEKVPKEALFFPDEEGENRSIFFQNLIEYLIVPIWNKEEGNIKVDSNQIYQKTFAHLASYRAVVDATILDYATEYQTGQRSGICSFKVLLPLLFYRLDPKERLTQFRWFRHQLGFYSTLSFYNKMKNTIDNDTSEASRARYLLKYGAKKILLRLSRIAKEKRENKSPISKSDIQVSYATMKQLLDRLEMIENDIANNQQKLIKEIDCKELSEVKRDLKTPIEDLQKKMSVDSLKNDNIDSDLWVNSELKIDPKTILNTLKEIKSIKNSRHKAFQIERLLESLPIPSKENENDFWSEIPKEDVFSCLEQLGCLFIIYNTFPPLTLEQANVIFAAYAMIITLAKRFDKERDRGDQEPCLADYGVYFPIDVLEEDYYTTFYSKKTYERRLEIIHYFKSEKKNQLFDFGSMLNISLDALDNLTTESPIDSHFYNQLIDTNKDLRECLKKTTCSSLSKEDSKDIKPRTRQLIDLITDVSLAKIETVEKNKETKKGHSDHGGFLWSAQLCHIALLKFVAIGAQMAAGCYLHAVKPSARITTSVKKENSFINVEINQLGSFSNRKRGFKSTYLNKNYYCYFPSKKMHRPINDNLNNYFTSFEENQRFFLSTEGIGKENRAMIEEFSESKKIVTPFTYSAKITSLSHLQPYEVLYYFRHYERAQLSKPEGQTAFEIQFFKSFTIKDKEEYQGIFPLLDELKKDSPLIEQSAQFIEEGIDYYYYAQPEQRPNVHAALFFLRLSIRLKDLIFDLSREESKEAFPDEKALLLEWLDRDDVTKEEKSAINLHLLFYFSKMKADLTEEESLQVLTSWVYTQQHLIKEEWRDPSMTKCVEKWIHKVLPEIQKNMKNVKDFLNPFFTSVLKEYLGREKLPKGDWSCDNSCYILRFENTRFWKINIQTGDIATEEGKVDRTEPLKPKLLNDRDFRYLFGENSSFDANKRGDSFYFTSSLYGELRVREGVEDNAPLIIQRRIMGEWVEYLSPIAAYKILRSGSLCADHTHWIHSSKSKNSLIEICDRKTGKPKGQVTKEGIIEFFDGSQVVMMNQSLLENLVNFEELSYLLFTRKERKWEIAFPRFKTIDGNTLKFKANSSNDKFISVDNENLSLSTHSKVKWRGGFKNYLILSNKKGNAKKLLIPCRPLPSTALPQNASLQCSTYVGSEVEGEKIKMEKLYEPQEGRDICLEFDLKEGVPIAQNTEGKLLLAYIALVQKDYYQAYLYFNQLSSIDLLSPLSRRIIDWIMNSEGHHTDASHDAKAIRLQAAVLLLRSTERPEFSRDEKEKKELLEKTGKFIEKEYFDYISLIDNVDRRIRLSKKNELQLFVQFPSLSSYEISYNRLQFLQSGLYPESKETRMDTRQSIGMIPGRSTSDDHFRDLDKLSYSLDSQPFSLTLTHPTLESLEKSFRTLYNLARLGTESDKEFIRFLLVNIEIPTGGVKGGFEKFGLLLSLLELALDDDYEYELPSQEDSKEVWVEWLKKVSSAYREFYKNGKQFGKTYLLQDKVVPFPFTPMESSDSINPSKEWDESPSLHLESHSTFSSTSLLDDYLTSSPMNEKETFISFEELELTQKLIGKDEIYQKAFDAVLEQKKIDYEEGVKINQGRKNFLFKDSDSCILLKTKLEDQIQTSEEWFLNETKANILRLANRLDSNEDQRQQQLLQQTGGLQKKIEMEELIQAFLKGNRKGFHLLNSKLEIKEVDLLFQWIGEYCQGCTEVQQAKRALHWIKKIEKLEKRVEDKKSDPYLLEKERLIRELGTELSAKCVYDPSREIDYLVFEYRSGMRIRPVQREIIDKMCLENNSKTYDNLVIQLIMGGGKSKLIGPLVSYKAASRKDRLALFVVPSALYNNIKEDLKESQKQNFGQGINTIHLEREQFSLENLTWVKNALKRAIDDQEVVVVKGELLQSLCLEYWHLNHLQAYNASEFNNESELSKKIQALKEILVILTTQADGVGDEVDQLLNVLKAVNFPVGEEESLSAERVDLVREIYLSMSSGKLKEKIGLHENRQNLLQESDYLLNVKPEIAHYLASLKSLCLPEEQKEAFIRYVTDTKDENNHAEFLLFLQKLHLSQIPEEQEASHLIAVAYYVLNQVLPITLNKNNNRHYGRSHRKSNPDLVVPYDGVGSPSKTSLIGNPWEAVCLHFQTAINTPVTPSQIRSFASSMKESADHFAEKFSERTEESTEAIEFQALTGVALHHLEKNIDKALENVNQDIRKRLQIESHSATSLIKFHTQKFNSASQMLPNLLSTKRMVSGTPWNLETYDSSLSENIHLEVGTEGQITDTLLRRAKKSENKEGVDEVIHFVTSNKSKKVLEQVLSRCKRKDRVRSIIDTGALFKDYSHLETATGILDYYKKETSVEAVVFHYLGSWALLKKGATAPILLKNMTPDEVESKGVPLDKIFFYYDEKNTTGTDFVQSPNAINLLTCDPGMLERTFFQGAMRARQLLFGQDLEYVIHKNAKDLFVNKAARVKDILSTCIKNQIIRKSKDLYKAYLQKLDYALKKQALKELLNASFEESPQVFKKFESILIDRTENNPFKQFGSLNSISSPLEAIKKYAATCYQKYPCKEIEEAIANILKEAEKYQDLLPLIVTNSSGAGLDTEQEIELQTQVEEEKDIQIEVDKEVQKELESYQKYGVNDCYSETSWSDEEAEKFFKGVYNSSSNPLINMTDHLNQSQSKKRGVNYTLDYSEIFEDNLYLTKNFSLTVQQPLPVFHPLQKCGEQILFIKEGEDFRAYFVSGEEALFFKGFLEKNSGKGEVYANVWLTLPDGQLFTNPQQPFPINNPAVEHLLMQINFFNGNILYLDKNSDQLESWLEEGAIEEGKNRVYEAKVHFIKRRVRLNQREALYRSGLLDLGSQGKTSSRYTLIASRKEQLAKPELWISKLSQEKIKKIASLFVRYLPLDKIQYLGRSAQITKLLPHQIKAVTSIQVPLLNTTQLQFLETKDQINAIASMLYSTLSWDQLRLLSDEKLQLIDDVKLINGIPEELIEKLTENQKAKINWDQVRFMKSEEEINQLDPTRYGDLSLEQWGWLKQDKLQAITDPKMIRKIPASIIPQLTTQQLEEISSEQITHLSTKEQINALKVTLYKKFTEEQWMALNEDKLLLIKDRDTLKKVPHSLVKHLTQPEVCYLEVSQVPFMSDLAIPFLTTKKQVDALKREAYVNLTSEQWGWLDPIQLQQIKEEHLIRIIPPEHYKHLTDDQISCFKTAEQIDVIDPNLYEHLSGSQLQLLNNQKLHSITNPKVINKIGHETLERLVENQIGYLTKERLEEWEAKRGYWTSIPARRVNRWLNKQSHYYQIDSKEGWRKVYYAANLVAPAKIAHLIAVAVNIATVVTELFIAIALLPILLLKAVGVMTTLTLYVVLPSGVYNKLREKVRNFFYNWNWSSLGHFNNAMAYLMVAILDIASVMLTPKLGYNLNARVKKWQRIILIN